MVAGGKNRLKSFWPQDKPEAGGESFLGRSYATAEQQMKPLLEKIELAVAKHPAAVLSAMFVTGIFVGYLVKRK